MKSTSSFVQALGKARGYGIGEFLEIIGELSQESTRKGKLGRKTKELVTFGIALHKQCERCICIHADDAKRVGASEAELEQVRRIALFMRSTPGKDEHLWKSWKQSWKQFVLARGAIKHRHRELVALGISIVMQHKKHIRLHVRSALGLGHEPAAIVEVMPIALLMDGAPALSQIPSLMKALEKAEKHGVGSD
ncbi:carboxymuconolactone decarboxylase family protein [Thiolapillus sp.]